jgi:hypothetical protein
LLRSEPGKIAPQEGKYAVNARWSLGKWKWYVVALIAAFAGIQFLQPALPNPPVTAEIQLPPDVKQILRISCYNCHSNETTLSWFDKPAPAYWLVAKHVKEGRERMNFSEVGKLPLAQQQGFLFESVSQIELGAMPLPAYERLHPESRITPEQLAVLKNYLRPPATKETSADDIKAADAQYDRWIHASGAPANVAPSPNGIAFLPDYKNWKSVSSTDRGDNHTLRVILGNDVAIRAIAQNQINPWPDGAAFAKVAWLQQANDKGNLRPGAFFQVEFMIRDATKYADTLGWGFARWRGSDLKPYGKHANFTNECVGCHSPLTKTNYVFTMPIGGGAQ